MAYDALDPAYSRDLRTRSVLAEVLTERKRQDEKWGEQNHVSIVDGDTLGADAARHMFQGYANSYKAINDSAAKVGTLDWYGIFLEEVYEALAEKDEAKIRAELVQAIAVGVGWIECIDRRAAQAGS